MCRPSDLFPFRFICSIATCLNYLVGKHIFIVSNSHFQHYTHAYKFQVKMSRNLGNCIAILVNSDQTRRSSVPCEMQFDTCSDCVCVRARTRTRNIHNDSRTISPTENRKRIPRPGPRDETVRRGKKGQTKSEPASAQQRQTQNERICLSCCADKNERRRSHVLRTTRETNSSNS